MKRTIDLYIQANYDKESIATLEWLESCTERLGDFLDSYRYLQPDGELFSKATISNVYKLYMLEIAKHIEAREFSMRKIADCNHEIHIIENEEEVEVNTCSFNEPF